MLSTPEAGGLEAEPRHLTEGAEEGDSLGVSPPFLWSGMVWASLAQGGA